MGAAPPQESDTSGYVYGTTWAEVVATAVELVVAWRTTTETRTAETGAAMCSIATAKD